MPAYEITVSVPHPREPKPRTAQLRISGPYSQDRAKAEALRLAKGLTALEGSDFAKAEAVVTTRMSIDDFVAARRSKSAG